MNSPTKRIAWITGGGTGIGLAGAASLAKEGWQVVISGRRSDVLSKAADAIRSHGGAAVDQIVLDVENVEQVNETATQILKKHNRIDLLINSAGLNVPNRSWESVTTDAWDSVVHQRRVLGWKACHRSGWPRLHGLENCGRRAHA